MRRRASGWLVDYATTDPERRHALPAFALGLLLALV